MGTDEKARQLVEWFDAELGKLGLEKTDCDGIFWDKGSSIPQCRYVSSPRGKTREQLEELISELKSQLGIEPPDC